MTARLEPDLKGPAMVDAGTPTTFSGVLYAYADADGTWARVRAYVAAVPVEIVEVSGRVVARGSTGATGAYAIPVTLDRGEHTLFARAHRGTATEGRSAALAVVAGERPTAPTDLVIVESRPDHVNLTWGPPEDDGGLDRVRYRLYRGDNGGPLRLVANLDPSFVGYDVNFSVPANTDLRFELRAYNALGEGPGASKTLLRKVYPIVEVEITHVRVCRDGGACVNVPPGGSADVWTGRYTYTVHFAGSAGRDGVAWSDAPWRTAVHDTFQSRTVTTTLTGRTAQDGTFGGATPSFSMEVESGCNMGHVETQWFQADATVDFATASHATHLSWDVRFEFC